MIHTPGPWTAESNDNTFQMDIEPSIATVYGTGGELQATAALIASAPELLEALEDALFVLEWAAEDYQDNVDLRDRAASRLPAVRAAIAKAKGE